MWPELLTWLNAEFVQKVLRSSENDDSIEVKDVATQLATAIGDNYLSHMIRVNVEYLHNKSNCKVTEKKSIIIKIAPTTGAHADLVSELGIFDTEIKMMENTLVKMNAMLKDEGYRLSARVLHTENGDSPLIVIEDLTPLGYRMADRQAGLDLEHCILAMRGLARFHATSVAVWEKDPKEIANYRRNVFHNTNKKISNMFPNMLNTVAKELLNWTELGSSRHSYSEKFTKLSDRCLEIYVACTTPNPNEFNVLNHGDCWVNNMLFRYNDEGKVIDQIFVDFQFCIMGSPAIDILNFTNTSLSEVVEIEYQDVLLEVYLDVLGKSLTTLHCDTKVPDMAALKKSLAKYQFLAIISSCVNLPFALVDKSKANSLDEIIEKGENYVNPGFKGLKYRKKMLRRLPAWNADGVFDVRCVDVSIT